LPRLRLLIATALFCLLPAAGAAAATTGAFRISLAAATQYDTTHSVTPLKPGFVGVSMEYCELLPGIVDHQLLSGDLPTASGVLSNLIAGLAPGQRPVLRLGGDSSDHGYWAPTAQPARTLGHCPFHRYALSPAIVGAVSALARSLDARLIIGLNLKSHDPMLAAAEAAALSRALDPPLYSFIDAFEIGNEPDLYPIYGAATGFAQYLSDFSAWAAAARAAAGLPTATVAGPSLGRLGMPWISGANVINWQRFQQAQARPRLFTFHAYPLLKHDCPSALCPSIPALIADNASHGLAEQVAPFVAATHAPTQVRIDELNSVTGEGVSGVSDTFASALWALDTLFEFEAAGVSGVNVHTIFGAPYALFDNLARGRWAVRPEYYGLETFALASPPGSRLLSVSGALQGVKVWADGSSGGATRIVIINKDSLSHGVALFGPAVHGRAFSIERLLASTSADAAACRPPYLHTGMCATGGITLGGRSFGAPARGRITGDVTVTGRLAAPQAAPLPPCSAAGAGLNCQLPGPDGAAIVTMPPASAALLVSR
jgi:hypothetical protein